MPYCPNCGTEHQQGARFCQNCGQALGEDAPNVPPEPGSISTPGAGVPLPPPQPSGGGWIRNTIIVLLVILVLIVLAGTCSGNNTNQSRTPGQEEPAPSEESDSDPAPADSLEGPSPGTIPGDGTFVVGDDVQPGTYRTDGGDGCYWARLADTSGDMESIIANDNVEGPTTVTIAPTDGAFETNDCAEWVRR